MSLSEAMADAAVLLGIVGIIVLACFGLVVLFEYVRERLGAVVAGLMLVGVFFAGTTALLYFYPLS